MKTFFYLSIAYLVFAIVVAATVMGDGLGGASAVAISAKKFLVIGEHFGIGIAIGLVVLFVMVGRATLLTRIPDVLYAFSGVVFLHAGFNLLKNSLLFITPFFADPFFAELDRLSHFGFDPWAILHRVAEYVPMKMMTLVYLILWSLPAFALPVILAASDGNRARVLRTLVLFVLAWVFLGNVVALTGFSAGPVFYDRVFDTDRFAALTSALHSSGVSGSMFGYTQQVLWEIYMGKTGIFGSGISAFPSVHVAIATVTAIYMCERSKWLFPVAVLFVLVVLFVSVYIGYHYAVDGYFSILFILAVWWWMRRNKYFA